MELASRVMHTTSWALNIANRRLLAQLLLLLFSSSLSFFALFTKFALGRATASRIREVFRQTGPAEAAKDAPVAFQNLQALPEPVLRYFKYCLKEGQRPVKFCALKQRGAFRLRASPGMRPSDGWKKVQARQYYCTAQPGYVWAATINLAPLLWIRGWDSYLKGKGHMLWKLFNAITLVNFGGREIDQSALVRYLTEAVYFPTALLPSRTLRWEALDADSARATLVHGGLCVSAVFHFNQAGQVTRLTTADRPRRLDDGTVAEDSWTGYYRDYQQRAGMQLPMESEFAWNLVGGQFSYAVLTVEHIKCWDSAPRNSLSRLPGHRVV